ncbi:hypothetical protein Ahy_B08g089331 [Arachis hypogaea]|uniref:PB1-like domain-containing protein n=1 Tax=Arachis hypogaea TaxID=3818 RepID=A0A444XXR0_ARAHY|nr:hypothetical protein Ahy_B08g089331 [Arachis hypogaea]
MATIHITLVISHREKFQKGDDGRVAYIGGEKIEIERVNVDTLNRFFMNDLVKDIGYTDVSELYWLEPGKELDGGLRLLRLDMDVVTMYEAAIANGRRVEVFTKHPVNLPDDEPNLPTHSPKVTFEEPPRIIQTPDAPTEPNLPPHEPLIKTPPEPQQPCVSVGSHETGHRNPVSAESVAPTVDKGPPESNEIFTQYIPQLCNEPEPPPSGQTFIPNQDPNKHPSIFIPMEGEDMAGPSAGMHCYESEELDSVASDDEDSQQAAFPQANPDAPVREVRLEVGMEFENLEHFKKAVRKFNINLGRSIFFPRVDSTRFWQLIGLPCRHACAALAYQNRRPEEHAHNWLSMGAYNSTYQFPIQPVPSQEYWEHVDLPPVLPPVYKKQIGRPKSKRDKRNDTPKEPTPDPHRAPIKYGPITCKYCLKKEAMAWSAGGQSASQHPPAADDEEEAARLEEMLWEETLEAVEAAEAAATQPPPVTLLIYFAIPFYKLEVLCHYVTHTFLSEQETTPVRPPTAKRPPKKKKNVRRPPPTSQQPRPPPPIVSPTTPTTTSSSPPASDVPPTVTPQTMQAASQGTTSRFMEFMPTPIVRVSTTRRWPQPAFRPPGKKGSTTAQLKEGSSGSSNSTPIP